MMKILQINDPHIGSPPRNCRPIYTDDVFNMLEEAREYVRDNDVELTIFTGDIFHSKQGTSHGLVRRTIQLLSRWPGSKWSIVGNHDLGAAGLSSVPSQPIGVVFESETLRWLEKDLIYHSRDGMMDILLSPANYTDDLDSSPDNFAIKPGNTADWRIKVAHGSVVLKSKDWPEEFHVIAAKDIPVKGMDIFMGGHIHNDQGMRTINGCLFSCTGSLGRVARTDYNFMKKMRLPVFTLTPEEISTDYLYLESAASPEDLFYERAEKDVEYDEPMAKFTRSIEKMLSTEGLSIEEALSSAFEGKVDRAVATAVKNHLLEGGWDE